MSDLVIGDVVKWRGQNVRIVDIQGGDVKFVQSGHHGTFSRVQEIGQFMANVEVPPHQPKFGVPFLAYTRRYGWVVADLRVRPEDYRNDEYFAITRPNRNGIYRWHILATAPLPPPPPEAA